MVEQSPLFFQIAAGLIPGFLFVGILSEGVKPPPDWRNTSRGNVRFGGLVLLGCFAVSAEIAAIRGALGTAVGAVDVWLVVVALVGGTGLLVLRALWPWLTELWKGNRNELALATATVVLLATLMVSSAVLLQGSVELASLRAQVEETERELDENGFGGFGRGVRESDDAGLETDRLLAELRANRRQMRVFERQLAASGLERRQVALALIAAHEAELRASQALLREPSPLTGGRLTLAKKRVAIIQHRMAQDARERGVDPPAVVQGLLRKAP